MITKEKILEIAKQKGKIGTTDLSKRFSVSRQYLNRLIKELVETGKLTKLGATRYAFYVLPEYAQKHKEIFPLRYRKVFKNISLEEHKVLDQVEQTFPLLKNLPENVRSIFTYAFSEMLNNAIEHSTSIRIGIEVFIQKKMLSFIVNDSGIGVFRNIMQKRNLKSELEAIQDLMKGKTTTMPKSHSGEGIFFTSKAGDLFILDSFGYQLIVNNEIPDVFVKKTKKHVKLYTIGSVHISRSQARRVLSGLEKFKIIVFDFDKVPVAGQAFADEIFRVFHNKHPHITLDAVNMNEGGKFMVERARNEAEASG